ncbi:glycine betaine ABC transporter substrate-binding protein [Allorhizocola rhizosphaerae]|uniref:glycine betaine ABC transporter substrate-binding protein n=1 Tax=Allorhizocola rhizosphaerae TaxID=1872709 RepID=UPI000E3D9021|nr:glycine betaine ABC transporter substrate-binding protein [Allorhizocola rhizosphaerae]
MRLRQISLTLLTGAMALAVGACGQSGSSGTQAPPSASGQGCAPVPGQQLVVLEDDKKLQNSDNIVAAINAKAATPALVAAVDKVAGALDTPKLIALNKAVDIDRKTSAVAAQEFAATAGLTTGLSGGSGAVKVGAANFTESQTLAELYKIALNAAGFQATVQTVGNREIYEPALEKGEIQVFPEYAATLTEFLNQKANGKDAAPKASGDITATMAALTELGTKYGLTFGKPSAAADQNAFAVTKAFADQHGLKTLSDFAAKCSGTASVLAGPPECPVRPFCQPGLQSKYGITFGSFHQADAGGPQTKTELTTGKSSLGLVFSSDGSLATN